MSNKLRIQLLLTFDYETFYSEADASVDGGIVSQRLSSTQEIEGAIEIHYLDRVERVSDQLAPLVQNLCFRAIPKLVNRQETTVSHIVRPGVLTLHPDQRKIVIESPHFATLTVPDRELLTELVSCGRRFESLANRVKSDDANYMAQLSDFPKLRSAAEAALNQMP